MVKTHIKNIETADLKQTFKQTSNRPPVLDHFVVRSVDLRYRPLPCIIITLESRVFFSSFFARRGPDSVLRGYESAFCAHTKY